MESPCAPRDPVPARRWPKECELIRRATAGESAALDVLFATAGPKFHHIAFSVLGNREDAEDAVQEGLLSAFRNLRHFEGRSRFSSWVGRIVHNAALMNLRRHKRHRHQTLDEASLDSSAQRTLGNVDVYPDPEECVLLNERNSQLLRGITRLSPLLRASVRLRHFEFMSCREIARRDGVDVNTIKSRNWRARKELARLLPKSLGCEGGI
jgi:RNA polymerase sigma-70 factor (ECF subfamily)